MTGQPDKHPPDIAYGFWRYGANDLDVALEMVEAARELGVTHLDTADVYGGDDGFGAAESLMGRARKAAPSLFEGAEIATKIGIEFGAPYNSSRDYLASAVEASLQRLQMECVDLLYIHRPDLLTHPAEVAAALDKIIAQGKAKEIALSNYTPQQIDALSAYLNTPIRAHQVEFSALHAAPVFNGVFDQAMAKGFSVYAWSPLAGGRLFADDPQADNVRAALAGVAEAHDCSLTVAALAFVMRHPARPTPILGTRRKERLAEAAAARDISITHSEWYAILEQSIGEKMP